MTMQRAKNYTVLLLATGVFRRKSFSITKSCLSIYIGKTVVCISNINIPPQILINNCISMVKSYRYILQNLPVTFFTTFYLFYYLLLYFNVFTIKNCLLAILITKTIFRRLFKHYSVYYPTDLLNHCQI